MKRIFLGLCILICTFSVGFVWAPLRFINEGVGSAFAGSGSFCSFGMYSSTQFERVESWSCSFEDYATEQQYLTEVKSQGKVISDDNEQILVQISAPESGYCSNRINEDIVASVCSKSLRHVVEFERQYLKRKY